jgi:drug/metabolite transporter (DMT)-like permease
MVESRDTRRHGPFTRRSAAVAARGETSPPVRPWLGMLLCALSMATFALQDAVTRAIVHAMAPAQIMSVRLWIFALGALAVAVWRRRLWQVLRPRRPFLQALRALLSALEMVTVAFALRYLGLAETHALFATFPLMAVLMAGPVLGERLTPTRLSAVLLGLAGALLIIRPGGGLFRPEALLALIAAALFAGYQVTGRLAARHDDFLTSVVQIALIGAVVLTPWGLWVWRPPTQAQWLAILAISALAILAHLLLVRALEHAEAMQLQPFNYLLMLFALLIGTLWFGERPPWTSWFGAALIVAGGLWAIREEHRLARTRLTSAERGDDGT